MPADQEKNRSPRGRFVKGQSGNPLGRPKGTISLPTALRKELPPEEFAKVLADKARDGESWACQIVADRYWPKTTNMNLDGELEVAARRASGPYLEPYGTSEEAQGNAPNSGSVH